MFADDTTLYDRKKPREINKKFEIHIKYLLEWCTYNRMDINWAKAFFMIVTSQRQASKINMHLGKSNSCGQFIRAARSGN